MIGGNVEVVMLIGDVVFLCVVFDWFGLYVWFSRLFDWVNEEL